MLRKCAAALAVSLVCLSGQAYAQQATAKATTSAVERVGAQAGRSSNYDGTSPWLLYLVFGIATIGIIAAANSDDDAPVSP